MSYVEESAYLCEVQQTRRTKAISYMYTLYGRVKEVHSVSVRYVNYCALISKNQWNIIPRDGWCSVRLPTRISKIIFDERERDRDSEKFPDSRWKFARAKSRLSFAAGWRTSAGWINSELVAENARKQNLNSLVKLFAKEEHTIDESVLGEEGRGKKRATDLKFLFYRGWIDEFKGQ